MKGAVLLLAGFFSLVLASLPARASSPGFSSPEAGNRLVAGTTVDVAWTLPTSSWAVEEMELVLTFDGGQTFPLRVTGELEGRSSHVPWRVPNVMSAEVRLALRAGLEGHEQILFLSPVFTILADALAPVDSMVEVESELWTREALEERQVPPLPPVGALQPARERILAGIPADASLESSDPHLFLAPARPVTVLRTSLSPHPISSDRAPESEVRVSLPKRE